MADLCYENNKVESVRNMFQIAVSYMNPRHTDLLRYGQDLGINKCVMTLPVTSRFDSNYVQPWHSMVLYESKRLAADFGMELSVLEGIRFLDRAKLGLDGRDDDIAAFCQLLEYMGALGIGTVCYNWMPVWGWFRSSSFGQGRGHSNITSFDYPDVLNIPAAKVGQISQDQLWTNLEYFLKKVIPVAEKYRIRLALHPDDPPVQQIAGIDRILITPDAMMEATKLVESEYNGICLCQGTFSAMGADVPAEIRRFGNAGKMFFTHFRDVQGTRDHFRECFHDEGNLDMYECVKAHYDCGFDGVSRPDHVPTMSGEDNSNPSYGIVANLFALGYMYGLKEAVEKERSAQGL